MRNFTKVAVVIVFILALGAVLVNRLYTGEKVVEQPSKSMEAYYKNKIEVQRLLSKISKECRMGLVDQAQNSFLDLQQEWQRMDVAARSAGGSENSNYFPSDSLNSLSNLIDSLGRPTDSDDIFKLTQEINRLVSKVDHQ